MNRTEQERKPVKTLIRLLQTFQIFLYSKGIKTLTMHCSETESSLDRTAYPPGIRNISYNYFLREATTAYIKYQTNFIISLLL